VKIYRKLILLSAAI